MIHLHKWADKYDTGIHFYKECIKCGKRKVTKYVLGGYQPINQRWLDGGEWEDFKAMPFASPVPVDGSVRKLFK